jgi:hypothetical protein
MDKTETMSGKIISFIKGRAGIVTAIFGLFGFALQKLLLKISDNLLGEFGFIFALLFAFITCMVFSLILRGDFKNRQTKKFRIFKNRLNTGIILSSIGLVCIGFFYFYLVNTQTLNYKSFDTQTRLLKGEYKKELNIEALKKSIIANNPPTVSVSEEALIREVGGSSEALYSSESLAKTRFLLLVVYCLFIIFFTAVTYIVPDIITVYYPEIENVTPAGNREGNSP